NREQGVEDSEKSAVDQPELTVVEVQIAPDIARQDADDLTIQQADRQDGGEQDQQQPGSCAPQSRVRRVSHAPQPAKRSTMMNDVDNIESFLPPPGVAVYSDGAGVKAPFVGESGY